MEESVEEVVREGLQGIVNTGHVPKYFTKRRLKELGVIIPKKKVNG